MAEKALTFLLKHVIIAARQIETKREIQMFKNECASLFAQCFPFWDGLADSDKELLCTGAVNAKYRRGQNIHGGGSECIGGIIVKEGCVRTYILSEDGREITLYRLYSGDICTLSASCVLKSITFDVFVDAETDCEVCIVSGKSFAQISDRDPVVENFALRSAVERFSEVMWVIQQILFMSFDKRLAIFLLDESSKTGSNDIRLTHEQIAKYMGSAREVVSRMLKYFTSEKIVELYRGGIRILDKQRLRALTA